MTKKDAEKIKTFTGTEKRIKVLIGCILEVDGLDLSYIQEVLEYCQGYGEAQIVDIEVLET